MWSSESDTGCDGQGLLQLLRAVAAELFRAISSSPSTQKFKRTITALIALIRLHTTLACINYRVNKLREGRRQQASRYIYIVYIYSLYIKSPGLPITK
jgi:hypothetical protein